MSNSFFFCFTFYGLTRVRRFYIWNNKLLIANWFLLIFRQSLRKSTDSHSFSNGVLKRSICFYHTHTQKLIKNYDEPSTTNHFFRVNQMVAIIVSDQNNYSFSVKLLTFLYVGYLSCVYCLPRRTPQFSKHLIYFLFRKVPNCSPKPI